MTTFDVGRRLYVPPDIDERGVRNPLRRTTMIDRYLTSAIAVATVAIWTFIALAIAFPALITLCGISASGTLIGLGCCISDRRLTRRPGTRTRRRAVNTRRAA